MKNFEVNNAYLNFKGQTGRDAAELINILNECSINKKFSSGNFFESGTYYGKSACIFLNLNSIKKGFLVDLANYLEIEKLKKLTEVPFQFEMNPSESFNFEKLGAKKSYLWAHLDASHYFSNVQNEILNIIPYMHDYGLICLDDWNDVYSQVRAAYYYLYYKNMIDWELILTGFNKAFICKKSNFDFFHNIILEIFTNKISVNNNQKNWQLSRTDNNINSRNFNIRKIYSQKTITYGENIWGKKFYTKV